MSYAFGGSGTTVGRNSFDINETISGSSTSTVQIDLDRADYDHAIVHLGTPDDSPNNSVNFGKGMLIFCTTDENDSSAMSETVGSTAIKDYSGTTQTVFDWRTISLFNRDAGFISSSNYGTDKSTATFTGNRLNWCRINGDKLEFEIENLSAGNAVFYLEGEYRVFKNLK